MYAGEIIPLYLLIPENTAEQSKSNKHIIMLFFSTYWYPSKLSGNLPLGLSISFSLTPDVVKDNNCVLLQLSFTIFFSHSNAFLILNIFQLFGIFPKYPIPLSTKTLLIFL